MSDNPVSLDLIGRQYERMLSEIGSLRDDMRVLTAIVLRLEQDSQRRHARDAEMLNQMRAMVAQHRRFGDRLLGLDERLRVLEEERR
ncbi:MAG TPA: hypothetical protein VFA12_16150 [Stellaceae bacterium]|nr:hypothetical protein [Stellaceae bacterium]